MVHQSARIIKKLNLRTFGRKVHKTAALDKTKFRENLNEKIIHIEKQTNTDVLCKEITEIIRKTADETIPKSTNSLKQKEKFPNYIIAFLKLKKEWAKIFRRTKCSIAKKNANCVKIASLGHK